MFKYQTQSQLTHDSVTAIDAVDVATVLVVDIGTAEVRPWIASDQQNTDVMMTAQ